MSKCSLLNKHAWYTRKIKSNFNFVFAFWRWFLSQPHFGQVWGWSPTLGKVGDLETSGTPECLELDSKAQNTLHWGVLGVIGKVLKRRYRKWPRIGHLDIFSPSYGRKKGREWNCQFDSRPLILDLFPTSDLSVRHGFGKILMKATTLVQTSSRSDSAVGSYGRPKFRKSSRDNFGTPFRESWEFMPFGCSLHAELQRILYGGRWWLPSSSGRGESCVSKCPWLVQHPRVFWMLNWPLVVGFWM
jgi:hypothetical protein